MGRFHDDHLPGESPAYRAARDELLEAEIELRRQSAEVAALRRRLPEGGPLKEDYTFDEGPAELSQEEPATKTRLSELFASGKDTLVIYSFMYAAEGAACPMCVCLLDSLNAAAPHITQRVGLAVVARAPLPRLRRFARGRDWRCLRLLSSQNNSYNVDYRAERSAEDQIPALNIFRRQGDRVWHFYNAELLYAPAGPGGQPRHVDPIWPLWNLLDMTPDGRGEDWYPSLSYG